MLGLRSPVGGLEGLHGELEGGPYMGLGTRVWVCEASCVVFEGARVWAWGGPCAGLGGPVRGFEGAHIFVSSSQVSDSVSYLTQQTFCFSSVENAQRLAPPMSPEDFFARKSNYEMGKEFASWHCPALSVLRVSDLRLLKNLLLFFQTYVFYHWLVRKKKKKPGFINVRSATCTAEC